MLEKTYGRPFVLPALAFFVILALTTTASSQALLNSLSDDPPGISPSLAATGGGPFALTLKGAGFTSNSTARLGVTDLVTTFIDANTLSATVPGLSLKTPGVFGVTVFDAGGTSNAVTLTVTSRGDANGNSTVNIGDAVTLARSAGGAVRPPVPVSIGDLNLNDTVNIGDALVSALFSGGLFTNLDVPVITQISPSPAAPGTLLQITGTKFSSNASDDIVVFTKSGGGFLSVAAASVTAGTGVRTLTVTVPDGAASGPVFLKRKDTALPGEPIILTINGSTSRIYLTSVAPFTGIGVGTVITLSGTGFDPVAANNTITFSAAGNSTVTVAASTSSTASLTIQIPAQAVTGFVQVTAGAQTSNRKSILISGTPSALRVNNVYYPDSMGESVLIEGTGFNAVTPSDNQALFATSAGEVSGAIVAAGRTQLIALVPAGATGVVRVVNTSGTLASNSFDFINAAGGGNTSPVAAIVFLDATNSPVRELVVNEGNVISARVRVLDGVASIRTDVPVSYSSLDVSVATVDASGNISGRRAGFSTLTATAGGVVATLTVTVVQVSSSTSSVDATSVAQDLSRRLYLASSQNHTVLLAQDISQAPSVYAGVNQTAGFLNDQRLQSLFRRPSFLAFNQADGSLYVSDSANNVIRRIVPGPGGLVETFAGTGSAGNQDGPAANSTFNNPQGVAFDNAGNLWVVDSGNNTVRRINLSTKTVQTVAGLAGAAGLADGDGAQARFNSPVGIALQGEDVSQQLDRLFRGAAPPTVKMLVADAGNGVLRRVSDSGHVETIGVTSFTSAAPSPARNAQASAPAGFSFAAPSGVAVDPVGNIFVTEPVAGGVKVILRNGSVVPAVQSNTLTNPKGLVAQSGKVIVAGTGHSAQELTYGKPVISTVTPAIVLNTGSATALIRGSNFAPETTVLISGVAITAAEVRDSQTIALTVPAIPSGRTTLTILNRGGLAQQELIVSSRALADLPVGYITTVVGGSTYIGDGGPGPLAAVSYPAALAVDSSGNLFIADSGHQRIRRLDAQTGIVTTVAGSGAFGIPAPGGLAVASPLEEPAMVAVDGSGNVYFQDSISIFRVDARTGILSTVVNLSLTYGQLAADTNGNLFIADELANKVYRIDAGSTTVTTIAGGGTPADGLGDGLPAAQAVLHSPKRIALDAAGNIFISEGNVSDFRIRKIAASTGIISTVTSNVYYPRGLALDAVGVLYAITQNGTTPNWGIRKINVATGELTTIREYSDSLHAPVNLASDAGGNLYVSDYYGNTVNSVDATTGALTVRVGIGLPRLIGDNGPAVGASISSVASIAFDRAGNLLIADTLNARVRKVDTQGTITTIAGDGHLVYDAAPSSGQLATQTSIYEPRIVDADPAGNVWFYDFKYFRIDAGTGVLTKNPANFNADDMAVAPNGDLFLVYGNTYSVFKMDPVTGVNTPVAGNGTSDPGEGSGDGGPATQATFHYPQGIAVDRQGNIFIADVRRIRRIDAVSGIITTVAGGGNPSDGIGDGLPATQAKIYAIALDIDAAGNIFFCDGFWRIRRVDAATGIITTVASLGSTAGDNIPANSSIFEAKNIAVDPSGNIYFTELNQNRIRAIRGPFR